MSAYKIDGPDGIEVGSAGFPLTSYDILSPSLPKHGNFDVAGDRGNLSSVYQEREEDSEIGPEVQSSMLNTAMALYSLPTKPLGKYQNQKSRYM